MRSTVLALLCGSALASFVSATPAAAQVADAAPNDPAAAAQPAGDPSDIVVTGTRQGEAKALATKRAADNVVEALYANDVGRLPDQNVAEAVKRLPGIAVANDQGEGRYVIVRGIDPNLVNVTLNGQTLPAPEPDGREVKLDDIPSAMIGSVVVTKSLLPSQDANAIGGEVDIRTLSAFDRNKPFFIDARGAAGWYKMNDKSPWEVDGQVGGIFGANDQFGAVLSVNYSRRPIESENFQGSENYSNGIYPDQGGLRDYNLVRTRLGVVGNFDWRPSDTAQLFARLSYSRFTDKETRDQNRVDSLVFNTATGTYTGRGSVLVRQREEDDNTRSGQLGGSFETGNGGKLELSGGYTRAVKEDPIRSEFRFRTSSGAVSGTYDVSEDPFVLDPFVGSDLTKYKLNSYNFETRLAVEKLWQGRADYTLPIAIGEDSTLKVGFKYLDRHKTNDQNKTDYTAGSTSSTLASAGTYYYDDTSFYGGDYSFGPRIDYWATRAYIAANPTVLKVDEDSSIADSLSSDYDVREQITAGYVMATFKMGQLTLIPGVRVEHTHDRVSAKIVDENSTLSDGYNSFGSKSYTDFFPGVNAKFDASQNVVLRAAVTTSIGRPNYPDLAPYVTVDTGESPTAISLGNPDLKPYKATNADLSAEWYLPGQGLISLAYFYKDISNPIYTTTTAVANATYGGVTYATANLLQPTNIGSSFVSGIEVNVQKRFTQLPAPFDGLGISANYTHIAGHAKGYSERAGNLPLMNQSHDVGTAQLFYEKSGVAIRVAYTYRSAYLDALGTSAALDEYTDDNGQLDAHASYEVTRNVTIFADGTNLTNAPWRRFMGASKAQLIEREQYDMMLRGGVQVHF